MQDELSNLEDNLKYRRNQSRSLIIFELAPSIVQLSIVQLSIKVHP